VVADQAEAFCSPSRAAAMKARSETPLAEIFSFVNKRDDSSRVLKNKGYRTISSPERWCRGAK
jgi:hypothetical protein